MGTRHLPGLYAYLVCGCEVQAAQYVQQQRVSASPHCENMDNSHTV